MRTTRYLLWNSLVIISLIAIASVTAGIMHGPPLVELETANDNSPAHPMHWQWDPVTGADFYRLWWSYHPTQYCPDQRIEVRAVGLYDCEDVGPLWPCDTTPTPPPGEVIYMQWTAVSDDGDHTDGRHRLDQFTFDDYCY